MVIDAQRARRGRLRSHPFLELFIFRPFNQHWSMSAVFYIPVPTNGMMVPTDFHIFREVAQPPISGCLFNTLGSCWLQCPPCWRLSQWYPWPLGFIMLYHYIMIFQVLFCVLFFSSLGLAQTPPTTNNNSSSNSNNPAMFRMFFSASPLSIQVFPSRNGWIPGCWQLERQIGGRGHLRYEDDGHWIGWREDNRINNRELFFDHRCLCLFESLKGFVTVKCTSKSCLIFWEIGIVYLENEQVDFNQTGLRDVCYSFFVAGSPGFLVPVPLWASRLRQSLMNRRSWARRFLDGCSTS